jgi:hypothetical protein
VSRPLLTTAAEIATALEGWREGRQWRCRCPIHGGRSLLVRDGDTGGTLVFCHGGCEARDLLAELRRSGLLSGTYPQGNLSHARMTLEGLDVARVVTCLKQYLDQSNTAISRAQAEERMWAKLANPAFMADVRPLLEEPEGFDDVAAQAAFKSVFTTFITRFPGERWARTKEMAEHHGMPNFKRPCPARAGDFDRVRWSAASPRRAGRRGRSHIWRFLERQDNTLANRGFRLGAWCFAGVCSGMARDGERSGRGGGFGLGYRASPR